MAVRGFWRMSDRLTAFLCESGDRSFAWGQCDCALWACDWIKRERGVDPGEPYRGQYSSPLGCGRLLRRHGGLLALASEAFDRCGLSINDRAPIPGDVVCASTPAGAALMIAIGEHRFAWKARQGMVVADFALLRSWSICHA
jgi:hypothetical protein